MSIEEFECDYVEGNLTQFKFSRKEKDKDRFIDPDSDYQSQIQIKDKLGNQIGYLMLNESDYGEDWDVINILVIDIDKDKRGQGYGSDVIESLTEWACGESYYAVDARSIREDEWFKNRISLFERLGFECDDKGGSWNCYYECWG